MSDGLSLRETPDKGWVIPDLTQTAVTRATYRAAIDALIRKGNKKRKMASTDLNEHSSRSHAIFTVTWDPAPLSRDARVSTPGAASRPGAASANKLPVPGPASVSFNIVDLAGSERSSPLASAAMQKETNAINKSLSTLGNCIAALAKGDKFVPYARELCFSFS